ncbi:Ig-like domain-containing protein [Providencia sp. Me31A]|uniref:Ig-like domain-containing protein n=1 Tax=Providencia sp. Me31A TaxID=3392637 RepID=UPI003D2967E8
MKTGSREPVPQHYKLITWLNIITQISFPLACTFTPIMASSSNNYNHKLLSSTALLNYRQTQPYILKKGESITTVAKQYNMSVDSLRKLNQFRTFARPFEQLKSGDELDIPMAPLPTIQWDDKKHPQQTVTSPPEEMKLAQFTSQAGQFLSNKPSVDSAEKLARNMVMSTASDSIQQWLNRTGKAEIRLEADEDFSLSNSQLDLLHPIYETKEKLIFTQGSLHRSDDRLQTNLGIGIRWFGDQQMLGGNTFFDYDISRGHTRLGLGAEYRRNYLKISANSYHPLTHWKSSQDLADYTERPAHGWDIRAEGWLPSYPHLGSKLIYEQYYGDQVALFNSSNLQRNPQAITAGINYTPFPLLTLSAEHRQGKSNQQDSRFTLNISYYLGKTWKQHVDSEAVSKLRSLVGSRYDFVNRNNNIILQYQKSDVIHLSFTDVITGFAGEKKPLPFNVSSKYGFDHIKWSAPQVVAAGGQIIDEKNGKYSIIMPEYKFGAKAINQYFINAVAVDKKNNVSPNATLQLIVNQPKIDISTTTLSPTNITLVANGKSKQTLTLLVKDKQGNPIDISSNEIRLEKTPLIKRTKRSTTITRARAPKTLSNKKMSKGKPAEISTFNRVASGKYTAILSASHQSESFNLTPIIRNTRLSPIQITIVADQSTLQLTPPTLNTTQPQVANGKQPIEVKVQLVDANNNPLPNTEVKWQSDKSASEVSLIATSTTDQNGFATTIVESTFAGKIHITATANGAAPQDITLNFIPDKTTSSVEPNNIQIAQTTTVANGKTPNPIEITVTDAHGNPVPNVEVQFSTDKGQLTANTVKTDSHGVAKTEITSTSAGNATITVTVDGKNTTQTIEFISDKTTSAVTPNNIHVANPQTVANGKTPNPIEITVTDAHGNPVPNVEVQFSTDKGQLTANTVKTDSHGVAKTEITSTSAGNATVTVTVDGKNTTQTIEFISDKTTPQMTPPILSTSQSPVANGKQPIEVKVQLVDANNNPLANTEVKWQSDKGANGVSLTETTITDQNGFANTIIESTFAGKVLVTATANGVTPQDITVQFVPDKSTVTIKPTDLMISHSSSIADGSTPNPIEVTVTDAHGNKVPNIEVTFATTQGKLVASKVITDANGVAKTQLTSTKTGNTTVTVTVGGNRFDKTISFVANHQTAKIDSVTPEVKNQYLADGKTTVAYTAKVVDANQNPIMNTDINWSSDVAEVVFSQGTSKTDDKGITTVMVTSTKAKPTVITATTNNHSLPASRITFVADSAQAQITTFNINKSTLIANQTDTAIIETLITDNYGNPLENIAVTLTSNRGKDDTLTALTPLFKTNTKGYVKAEVNTAKAGDMILSAQIANHSPTKSATLKAIADNTTASITITASQKNVQINANAKKVRLTATVKDGQNNPLANTPVTWLSNHNQLSTNTTQTNSLGQAQVELSGYTSGNTKVTAQLLNNTTEDVTIEFIADAAKTQNSILTIKPQTIVANGLAQATATFALKDQWDNPVTGKTVQWDSNNSTIIISDVRELATNKGVYQAKISGTHAGTFELTAISDAITKKINIGLIADNSTSTIDHVAISSQTAVLANGVAQITVQATVIDASGNAAANVPVGWKTEIGELNQLISHTDYRGIAQVTLTSSVAGRGKVSAILGTSTKETANEITFLAGKVSPSASTANVTTPSISVAVGKTGIIVNLKDDTGNSLWGLSKKITLSYSTDLGLNKTPLFTESQTTVGAYYAELSGIKAGKTNISIYVDGVKLDKTVTLTVTPNSQTARVRGDIVPVKLREIVGNNVTYTATFEDANANLLGMKVWTSVDN